MTTLENFYFGNINPSEYKQSKDTNKKLSEITRLFAELKSSTIVAKDKTKTASSRRSFPMTPEIKELLLSLKAQQKKDK